MGLDGPRVYLPPVVVQLNLYIYELENFMKSRIQTRPVQIFIGN